MCGPSFTLMSVFPGKLFFETVIFMSLKLPEIKHYCYYNYSMFLLDIPSMEQAYMLDVSMHGQYYCYHAR